MSGADRARPRLFGHPAWVSGVGSSAGRSTLLSTIAHGGRPRKMVRDAVADRRSASERRALQRGRPATLALAVLSNWGHATAHQIAEFGGLNAGQVRGALHDLLGAGLVKVGAAGMSHEAWPGAEFWSLDGGHDAEWMFDRFTAATWFAEFAGRPLGRIVPGSHSSRHDVFALDVALELCARGVDVETVIGGNEMLPAEVLGLDADAVQSSKGVTDVTVVGSDGLVLFVEGGIANDGGVGRVEFYADLAAKVGFDRFRVVFLSMRLPGDSSSNHQPERRVRDLLAMRATEAAQVRDLFRFADYRDWMLDDGGFAGRLPARRALTSAVDEFVVEDLLGGSRVRPVPGWVEVHRNLGSSHFLLPRSDDTTGRWADFLRSD